MTKSELESAALRLAPRERAQLAEKLLASLDDLTPEELDEIWAAECLRRDAELDANSEQGRSTDAVFADARARLR